MVNVEIAYRQCEQMIRQHSQTFYKAFSLLPEEKRKAVWAVYAFCRIVDDIVDEGSSPHEELKQFEQEFTLFLNGVMPLNNQYMWVALKDAFSRFQLDDKPFFDMLKGQGMDLVKTRYETMNEVLDYSYHVASTVGLMLLPILAPKEKVALKDGAIALGLGMQITNILRDIGEDLQRDRVYIPKELLLKYHYSHLELQHGIINSDFIQLWEHMAQEAEMYYTRALETMHLYPIASRTPVKASALFYREILRKIRDQGYRVFSEKQFVTNDEKSTILSRISG
ncbi:phytoene/squalene synthase family protein [Metabacillus endolithicus]|uniref:Phytoene/squalene synthase family protein n=1 Tax=Metabacillus endolithicus TaxID=1535204 RepID=A0ABW5C1M5_9BACI|nr:phytoene/squalene synthase family protein [Metabacillus endolithicus]UPG62346.1 phytoene/squalene synthase family protein [Metabacillus endolithicus]